MFSVSLNKCPAFLPNYIGSIHHTEISRVLFEAIGVVEIKDIERSYFTVINIHTTHPP